MSNTITATFKTRGAAISAINELEKIGITEDQVGLLVSDETRGKTFGIEESRKTDEGAATGATIGGLVGAVLAVLTSASAIAIPGLNVVATGYLVSALAGLGAGAATGGIIGGLVGAGVSEHEAKLYEKDLKEGAILLAIEAENHEQKEQIKEVLGHQDTYRLAA